VILAIRKKLDAFRILSDEVKYLEGKDLTDALSSENLRQLDMILAIMGQHHKADASLARPSSLTGKILD